MLYTCGISEGRMNHVYYEFTEYNEILLSMQIKYFYTHNLLFHRLAKDITVNLTIFWLRFIISFTI